MAKLLGCEYGGLLTGFVPADRCGVRAARASEELGSDLKHNEHNKTDDTRKNEPGGKGPLL
ncbi:hypothetical protein D3C73_1549090 [compost metagenome]